MSYLSSVTTSTDYGVVQVGSNIIVTDGIISIQQSLDPNASVTFGNIDVSGNLFSFGEQVLTSVTPSNGPGITLSDIVTLGPSAGFTVTNTGVLSLIGGTGTSVSGATGNITVTNTGVVNYVAGTGLSTTGNTGNITVTNTGVVNYVAGTGLSTTGNTGNITVTNTGVVELTANVGIGLSGSTGNVVVTNTGVTRLSAGSGISLSGNVGNITISSFGADLINTIGVTTNYTATLTDEYIGVSSAARVTITLPAGINGRVYSIKDEFGQGSGKITIQPQTGELIDSKTNYVISVPYQCISVVFRAGQWRII